MRAVVAGLRPTWSVPAAYRAARATIVMPSLFALSSQVIGNLQMATFAAFGSFATLVLAGFGGTRRDKLFAHLFLAVAGSVLLVIGTAVNATTWIAAVVTLGVGFVVLFGAACGPNAASGATAVLLAYVLPAASPGTISMVPSRLAGWWLASVVGTIAVLVLSPPTAENRLRERSAVSADALATELRGALAGRHSQADADAAIAAKHELLQAITTAPYRPTGLANADQALGRLVEALQWCTSLVSDLMHEEADLSHVPEFDRRLLDEAVDVLADTATVLRGGNARPRLDELTEDEHRARIETLCEMGADAEAFHIAFHARTIAAAAGGAATQALISARRSDVVANAQATLDREPAAAATRRARAKPLLGEARQMLTGNTSLRSVWFLNSARGALALAAAVAVADLTNVQHGFWVVLGTLSVLRTNAASTGATALRALGGTALGFFIGAGLILAIGSHATVLWAVLPLAVLVAAYSPGTAPFLVGQAAFTVTISILYNLLVPVGWKVGVLRIEDVAIGAGVSAVVGLLLWPRGATGLVGDDLADSFYRGGIFLVQATAWALGLRDAPPDGGAPATRAGARLDDALRALNAEQGTKHLSREYLWRLVGGATRLRLTAAALAGLSNASSEEDRASRGLVEEAVRIAGVYDDLAAHLGRTPVTVARELAALDLEDGGLPPEHQRGFALWVQLHLDHVRRNLTDLFDPAAEVAKQRARPWWR